MLENLKKKVYDANMKLVTSGLVILTWGNASQRDEETGYIVIKPSGIDYQLLTSDDMTVVNLNGDIVEGVYTPSSDILTHLEIYRKHPNILGICHTHSSYAVSFAQALIPIIPLGTTHADAFYGDIPVTRKLTETEVKEGYEYNTGLVINELIDEKQPLAIPGCLVASHGPFTWGKSAGDAVKNAITLEEVAKMNFLTMQINPGVSRLDQHLLDKHYFRKHGKNAYYGQKKIDKSS